MRASAALGGDRCPVFEALEARLLLDGVGPFVQAHWPDGPVSVADHIDLTFNEEIDPSSFTPDDVGLLDLQALEFAELAQIGGAAQDVAVSGAYAYLATVTGLRIVDVSDPSAPVLAGACESGGSLRGLDVAGSLAYAAAGSEGLHIFDVSNPSNPMLIGTYPTPGRACDVQVAGTLAYVAVGWDGMLILDVSTPSSPAFVDSCQLTEWEVADEVEVAGSLAYVGAGQDLCIVDVSVPSAPLLLGTYETPSAVEDVQVVGSLAYVANWLAGVLILDVSIPSAPAFVGSYEAGNYAQAVSVVGSLAYVGVSHGLEILDVAAPSAPAFVGRCEDFYTGRAVEVVGTLAYVADGDGDLYVVDVSTPSQPSVAGLYDALGQVRDVEVVGSLAFTADGHSGMQILDVSDPSAPVVLGRYASPAGSYSHDVEVVGTLAYLTAGHGGLKIVDISDPSTPTLVGWQDTTDFFWDVELLGDLAYVATSSDGMLILDISTPSAPYCVGQYQGINNVHDIALEGSFAYLAGANIDGFLIEPWVHILDVTDPREPVFLGRWETGDWPAHVDASGSLACVLGAGGVETVDVSDPSAPVRLTAVAVLNAEEIKLVGSVAYVAGGYGGISLMDVSDPAYPATFGVWDMPGTTCGVEVSGSMVYVAHDDRGVQILRIGPEVSGVSHLGGGSYRIDLGGYLTMGEYAVQIGPDILDLAGNRMDQDQDGTYGETDDLCAFRFAVVPIPGDANCDGQVNGADYTLWADHYKQPGQWENGDFTGDGWVDGADYTVWADNYGASVGGELQDQRTVAIAQPASSAHRAAVLAEAQRRYFSSSVGLGRRPASWTAAARAKRPGHAGLDDHVSVLDEIDLTVLAEPI